MRWEKTLALPVRRLEGAPKSRVFAYKHELDAWLAEKLQNGGAHDAAQERAAKHFWTAGRAGLAVLALGLISVVVWVVLPRPPSPATPGQSDVPASINVLDTYPGDLITSEFLPFGKLRVWRKKNETTYFEAWRMEPLRHTSMAFSDLDKDGDQEIIAPGYCRDIKQENGQTTSRIRFFLNFYKRGVKDWWKTSFFDERQCVYEKDDFEFTDVVAGDLDGTAGDEIVLITAHELSIHRLDPRTGDPRLVCVSNTLSAGRPLLLRSVVLVDGDNDGAREILVSANEWRGGAEVENKSWLIAFELAGVQLDEVRAVPVDGSVSARSLRVADIVPGGTAELVFPCYRKSGAVTIASVMVYDLEFGRLLESQVSRLSSVDPRPIHLDAGDIAGGAGDEVVITIPEPPELVCFLWNGERLVQGPKYPLYHGASVVNVAVDPTPAKTKKASRILAFGSADVEGQPGKLYLELVHYQNGFIPGWLRVGGAKEDIRISAALFAR